MREQDMMASKRGHRGDALLPRHILRMRKRYHERAIRRDPVRPQADPSDRVSRGDECLERARHRPGGRKNPGRVD